MHDDATIRTALERNVKAVTLRPSIGQGTAITKVRLNPGLACDRAREVPVTVAAKIFQQPQRIVLDLQQAAPGSGIITQYGGKQG